MHGPACPHEPIKTSPRSTLPEAGGKLAPMVVIGLLFAGELLGGEVMVHAGIDVTPRMVFDAYIDPGTGQYVLNAGPRHRAGREGTR